ncbi:ABC transporter ATP-binding protein [Alkalilacustris brevis]|uniref:ABC transporter ATP-binding protein n=1 Tax=Alkalilacustris brevis TaxID=2026338 RepID=UPI002367E825|nr:ABC transporter ATP-binding protein [Alkalilacustris brevis]
MRRALARDARPVDDPYSSRNLIVRLWHGYLKRHTGTVSVAAFFMVVEGSTLGLLSYMLAPLFDRVFVGGEREAIWWVGGAIFGIFVLRAITLVISKTLLTRVAQLTSTAMQVDMLRHLLMLDLAFYQKNPPGALMERVQGDTVAVQGVWQAIITGAGRDAVSLVGLLVVALLISPVWTAAALIGVPLLFLPVLLAQRYIRRKTLQMRVESGLRSTRLDEVFHGIMPIKLNRMEDYQLSRFEHIVGRIVTMQIKKALGNSAIPAMIDIVSGIGFLAVLLIGANEITSGQRTVGEFMSFFTAMALAFQPLRRLGNIAGYWQTAAASLERIYRLLDTEPAIQPPRRNIRPANQPPEIRLEDVHLAYGDLPVLRGVSFTAEAGRTTALVGPSGAGKSTVFNLLTRLVEPQSGRVTIGGAEVSDIETDMLREQISVVTQDAALFDETIRENVLLGRTDIDEARLHDVLEAAHVMPFARLLPRGLETPAGPRGSGLSGGQRQRVAIARALLRDAPVLLLDEATSALDAQSELLVQEALERLSQGRTTLVIAHRLATVRSVDRIVVMDGGRVVEVGTHDELLGNGGLYTQLCRLQFQDDG